MVYGQVPELLDRQESGTEDIRLVVTANSLEEGPESVPKDEALNLVLFGSNKGGLEWGTEFWRAIL